MSATPLVSPGPDRILDVGHAQLQKSGERVAGDTIRLRRIPQEERAVVVLSDGLGSGVKASVLSSLTATMAMEYATSDLEPSRVAGIIMRTLPLCAVRKIRYATFTAINARSSGNCEIVNYDNPGPYLLDGDGCSPVLLREEAVEGAVERRSTAGSGTVNLALGQYIVAVSDGVTQSGMGSRTCPFGLTGAGLTRTLREIRTAHPGISAQELSLEIVRRAAALDGGRRRDDISAVVVYLRRPRRLLLATGPPMDRNRDAEMARVVDTFPGRTVLAGGTTANLVARELDRPVTVNLRDRDSRIPPTSTMDGVDLVTEGTITMSRVAELLDTESPVRAARPNGASRLVESLLMSDEIHFLVGTKINEAHQNPNVPVELEIRRNLIKRICRLLEDRHLKRTYLQFI